MTRSPLAPDAFPEMPPVAGVRLAAASAGVKYQNRTDVMLAELSPGTAVAGVFTRSLTAAAPVDWCREILSAGRARAILVNSGNANAFTGDDGAVHVRRMARAAAGALGCDLREVFVASTGVIGERLPIERIENVTAGLSRSLSDDDWEAAARAIMTTDTFPKGAWATAQIDGRAVTVAGFAKGSGMIAPDMATMLAFVFTDAAVPATVLQTLLTQGAAKTFNCITVDSDTSTSDTVLLAATGQAGNSLPQSANDSALRGFKRALHAVLEDLATQVVRDGEGASKFVTIDVTGATSPKAARTVGLAIGNSPLVKTAIAGEDANWGRIVMAVGKAGEKVDRERLSVAVGGVPISDNGAQVEGYDETDVARHLQGNDIHIAVDLAVGRGRARVWTCDLTHDYIRINAEYRS